MNAEIAKTRMSEVMKTDTITTSQGDFMATHVPVKKLYLLPKYDQNPQSKNAYTEEEVYQRIVRNPENRHQFVIVYGASGAGKSHLIRWFNAKLQNDRDSNEVVLFIRRSDNSLKGTIRQLLNMQEIQDLPNKELYKRLVNATTVVNEDILKGTIYAAFQVLIQADHKKEDSSISNIEKKRLIAYLKDANVENRAMQPGGPVDRIYSKIAEHAFADRDTIAEFKVEDFTVDGEFLDQLQAAGSDRNAESMAKRLSADDGSFKERIVKYINQFVGPVIQQCANLEPGDFEEVFKDIRKELYKKGKNLTLFIEDITAFTGVDVALLNVLTTENTGVYEEEHMCRISSIVGTTDIYFQNNFNDNHKDRVTQFIYIPTDMFDESGLYEFVGKYMNAVSLPQNDFAVWVENGAQDEDFPLAEVVQGKDWDTFRCSNRKTLNLYPFTRRAINYLVQNILQPKQRTPRYILSEILEPVLQDALFNIEQFPSKDLNIHLVSPNPLLRTYILQQAGGNIDLENRMILFTGVWGDNSAVSYQKNGHTYIAGLDVNIYKSLDLPVLKMELQKVPEEVSPSMPADNNENVPTGTEVHSESRIDPVAAKRINTARAQIDNWINGSSINISSTSGAAGLINSAVNNINSYVFNVIDWQSYGISNDEAVRIRNSNIRLVGLTNQTRGDSIYCLPNDRSSETILECFIQYSEVGKNSWNYPTGQDDLYFVTSWLYKVRTEIVKAVKDTRAQAKTTYIEAAMASDMIRMILNGTYTGKETLNGFNRSIFFDRTNMEKPSSDHDNHSSEWKSLLSLCLNSEWDIKNRTIVDQAFNIIQGGSASASVFFVNYIDFDKTLKKVRGTGLQAEKFDFQSDDKIRQRRDVSDHLSKLLDRLDKVAQSEREKAKPYLERFKNAFDVSDIESLQPSDIQDFAASVKKFHNAINDCNINVQVTSAVLKLTDQLLKAYSKPLEAYKTIQKAIDNSDALTSLLLFASDPISDVIDIDSLIMSIQKEIIAVEKDLETKKSSLGITEQQHDVYVEEKELLSNVKKAIESYEALP